jgi:hypothetical protein
MEKDGARVGHIAHIYQSSANRRRQHGYSLLSHLTLAILAIPVFTRFDWQLIPDLLA